MDDTEAIAEKYLAQLGLGTPVYEPDGNVPPDFSLGRHIAVEVRRLNQNDQTAERPRGLEKDQIPLLHRMRRLLASLGPPRAGRSWLVSFRIRRPLEPWKTLEPELRRLLEEFAAQTASRVEPADLGSSLRLRVHPASSPHREMFVLGSYTDRDSGGWLLAEMERNLTLCIRDKTCKIQPYRAKYREWWLVFIDHIGFGLRGYERDVFDERIRVQHDWDRVVLIDPHDHTWAFDVPPSQDTRT
jgi:hypothetical protein